MTLCVDDSLLNTFCGTSNERLVVDGWLKDKSVITDESLKNQKDYFPRTFESFPKD